LPLSDQHEVPRTAEADEAKPSFRFDPSQTAQPNPPPPPESTSWLLLLVPQSQLFFQSYESILPTSLTYILHLDKSFLSLGTCCGYWYGDGTNEGHRTDLRPPTTHRFPMFFLNRCWRTKRNQSGSALPPFELLRAMTAFHSPCSPERFDPPAQATSVCKKRKLLLEPTPTSHRSIASPLIVLVLLGY